VRELFPQVEDAVHCDLLSIDAEALTAALKNCAAVLHIATAIPRDVTGSNSWDANTRLRTEGVRKLVDASLRAGVERYLQQSITMAYSGRGDRWITEEAPLDSSPERAQVCAPVIAMEQMLGDTRPDRLRWCVLRGGSFVGPGTFQDDVLARLGLGTERVPGDGRNYVSFIHVADMATAFVAAIEHAPAGSVFNVVDEPIRQGEYLDRLADSIGAPVPGRDGRARRPPSWRCSAHAARTVLRWRPSHGVFP